MKCRENTLLIYPSVSSPCRHSNHLHHQTYLPDAGGSWQVPHPSKPHFSWHLKFVCSRNEMEGKPKREIFFSSQDKDSFPHEERRLYAFKVRFMGERMGSCSMIEGKCIYRFFFSFLVLAFCYIAPLYWISCQLPQILCGCKVKITIMRTPSLLISHLWSVQDPGKKRKLWFWAPGTLFEFLGATMTISVLGNEWMLLHPPWKEGDFLPGRCFQ